MVETPWDLAKNIGEVGVLGVEPRQSFSTIMLDVADAALDEETRFRVFCFSRYLRMKKGRRALDFELPLAIATSLHVT